MEVIQKSRNIDLNDDLIHEILRWVSLDTLERCRLASKSIDEYTHSRMFTKSIYGRDDIYVGCIIQTLGHRGHFSRCRIFTPSTLTTDDNARTNENNPSFSLDFLPRGGVKVKVCTAGGLVYCRNTSTDVRGPLRSSYMCKPTTKEWVAIPNPETSFKTEAYAVVVKKAQPLQYFIIRFSKAPNMDSSDYTMFCEIFDSTTWLWRRTKDIKFEKSVTLVKKEATTTYVKGAVHFLTDSLEIFAFNIATENGELKPLPKKIVKKPDDNLYRHKLVQYRRKLKLYELTVHTNESEYMQIWDMTDYTKATWTKGRRLSREGHTFGLSQYDLTEWFYENIGVTCSSSYAEVKADGTNSLYFTQVLPFASDYEPVFFKPPRQLIELK